MGAGWGGWIRRESPAPEKPVTSQDAIARRFARLAVERVDNDGNGVALELLAQVELEFLGESGFKRE